MLSAGAIGTPHLLQLVEVGDGAALGGWGCRCWWATATSGGNALGTEEDAAEVLAGVRVLRRIAAAAPLAEAVEEELRPGPEVCSDEALLQDIRRRAGTVYHPSCTARMGPDPAAVVDARLRVHGTEGLRVADASAFPTLPGGNTNAPSILVGWRAGDLLR